VWLRGRGIGTVRPCETHNHLRLEHWSETDRYGVRRLIPGVTGGPRHPPRCLKSENSSGRESLPRKQKSRSTRRRRKQQPRSLFAYGPSPWRPAWNNLDRVMWEPPLGAPPARIVRHEPSSPQPRPQVLPPSAWHVAVSEKEIEDLEKHVRDVLADAHVRRASRQALDDRSMEITRDLLVSRTLWDRWNRGDIPAMSPGWILGESGGLSRIVSDIEKKKGSKISNYNDRIRAAIVYQRTQKEDAEEHDRRAKKRPGSSLKTLCKWSFKVYQERWKLTALVHELRQRRMSSEGGAKGKRWPPPTYVLAPLLNRLFARGIPDQTSARLLRLVNLPTLPARVLTPRQIKRIRRQR
jgi:hypothetical protein